MNLVIAGGGVILGGGVAEDILVVEFLVEVGINFVERLFLRDFEEAPAGSSGDLFENFFAVRTRFFGAPGIAAASSASAHSTAAHARASETGSIAVALFLVGEEDAIDECVGAQGGFERFVEGFLAAPVDTVGEDDEGFAAVLLFHKFVGGEVNRVVEEGAATATVAAAVGAASVAAATATRGTAAGTGLRELRRVELIDGREEFLTVRGKVLKEFDLAIEVDEESLIFVYAQDAIEESAAGRAFLVENLALAEAGVHEQSEGERKIGLLCEIGDGLGLAVLLKGEVVFGEIADDAAVFVADSGEEIDRGDVDSDGRGLLAEQRKSGEEKKQGDWEKFPQDEEPCLSLDCRTGAKGCSGLEEEKFPSEERKELTQRTLRKNTEATEGERNPRGRSKLRPYKDGRGPDPVGAASLVCYRA